MATISRVEGANGAVARAGVAPSGTREKVTAFMARAEGIGTVFSVLAGVVVAAVWGVSFGLLAAAVGGVVTLAIWSCRSRNAPAQVAGGLDPALQMLPVYNPRRIAERESVEERQERIGRIDEFVFNVVEKAILAQSPHFNNSQELFGFLRDHFDGLGMARLRLLSAHPGRFEDGTEAYEVTIQSEAPRGWIRCYVPKEKDRFMVINGANFRRIDRVTPFLIRQDAEENHFKTLNLPFRNTTHLRMALLADHLEMDLTQVRLIAIRNVSFNCPLRPINGSDRVLYDARSDGYEMSFETPHGRSVCYSSLDGELAAGPAGVHHVAPR